MTLADARSYCKALLARAPRDVLIVAIIILSASAAFGLGFLAGRDAGQGSEVSLSQIPLDAAASLPAGGQVVASKSGTKYFLPTCAGANTISAANKIYFASAADAVAHGYAPAANCKGL